MSKLKTIVQVLAVAAAVGFAPTASWAAQDMHATVIPQSSWGTVPEWIYFDIKVEDCEARGGSITGPQRARLCSIKTVDCESHAGYKVVERDAYRMASARVDACRRM